MSDNLENIIFRCIERWAASRYSERHGMVTSYDSKKYLAKVMFQPDGQESGWLPIETGHIGNGYGVAVGLMTGDGQQTGDQVIVRYQENDFEGGKIVQRVHSDQDKPPQVESGEMVMWTKWGQQIRFNKDGSLTLKTGVPTGQQQGQQGQQGQMGQGQQSQQEQQDQQQQQQWKKVTISLDNKGNMSVTSDQDQSYTAGRDINTTSQRDQINEAGRDMVDEAKRTLHDDAPSINHWANGGGGGPYNPGL